MDIFGRLKMKTEFDVELYKQEALDRVANPVEGAIKGALRMNCQHKGYPFEIFLSDGTGEPYSVYANGEWIELSDINTLELPPIEAFPEMYERACEFLDNELKDEE